MYPDLIVPFNQIVSVSLSFLRTLRFKFRETTESFTACVSGARKGNGEGKSAARATREGSEGEGKGSPSSLPSRVRRPKVASERGKETLPRSPRAFDALR